MRRRDFLKQTTVAAAALSRLSVLTKHFRFRSKELGAKGRF